MQTRGEVRLAVVLLLVASALPILAQTAGATTAPTFSAHSDLTVGGTGSIPYAVVTGDLRATGRSDIVVVDEGLNKVSVFLSNGDGTFAAKTDYALPSGTKPDGIAIGDFNGDGKPDLAVADNGTDQVSIFPNNGNGTFGTRADYSLPSGAAPADVEVGDFNGDGKPDLAVADQGTSQVSVLLNNGTGTFPSHTETTLPSGAAPDGIAVGDLNGDGKPDLAVSDAGSNQVSVLLNGGTGTFSGHAEYSGPAGDSPGWVVIGDFNGDGKPDIAVPDFNTNRVSVFTNSGSGTFGTRADYTVGSAPASIAAGDFNNDGRLDLVTANSTSGSVSVLLNTTSTGLPAITSANTTTFAVGTAGTFTVTATGTPIPTLSETGTLSTGVTFVDHGDGTATLSGTPTTRGTSTFTITAHNTAGPDATQTFTITVGPGWYNASWLYRKAITIDHTQVSASLTNFPVLISLIDSDLAAKAQSTANDVLFTSSDGISKMRHEIESYTPSTGTLVAWTKVFGVSNTVDTVIYMYYGNPAAPNQQVVPNTWDSNYAGVWHLPQSPTGTAPQFLDSTSNANNGTAQGGMLAGAQGPGKIADGITLNGTSTYISTTKQATSPPTDTVEAWFKTTVASGKKIIGYEDTQTGTATVATDRHLYVGLDGKLRFGIYDGAPEVATSTATVTDGVWHHAVGVQDDTAKTVTLYLDGVVVSTVTYTGSNQSYLGWWRIGAYRIYSAGWPSNNGSGYFPGSVDEVRVSTIARSSDWIATEYKNESSPTTFVSVSSEQINSLSITSAGTTTFTAGTAGTFTVTTTGSLTPNLSETGTLPTGVTFVDNGNGTATLSGTPTIAGSYQLTVTAHNTAGSNATQTLSVTVAAGTLSITVPATTNLGSTGLGSTLSGALGSVQIIDDRGSATTAWAATVSSTSFTSGGHTVPLADIKYWSGDAATTGNGTVTAGQASAAAAQDLTTSRTAFTMTNGNGIDTATWNPTLVVAVPITLIPGTYAATITHSVS